MPNPHSMVRNQSRGLKNWQSAATVFADVPFILKQTWSFFQKIFYTIFKLPALIFHHLTPFIKKPAAPVFFIVLIVHYFNRNSYFYHQNR